VAIGSGHLPAGYSLDAILLVQGDFSCGPGCTFLHPIYVEGDCEIGKGSRMEGVFCSGRLVLGLSVEVRSWAESDDVMDIRPGCRVQAIALSRTVIRLGLHCEVGRLSAPEIRTQDSAAAPESPPGDPGQVTELPPPGNERRLPPWPVPGIDANRLSAAGADTWFYDGDLYLAERVALHAHIVTRGYFACPAGSLLDGDVRSGSTLYVGRRSLVRGHLVANGDVVIEAGAIFQGSLRSRQRIRLCSGVRGFRSNGPVAVASGGSLVIEDRVVIRGSLASSDRIHSEIAESTPVIDWSLASGW